MLTGIKIVNYYDRSLVNYWLNRMFEMYTPVTVWKLNGTHNHIEYGWVNDEAPSAKFDNQRRGWNSDGWARHYKYLKCSHDVYSKYELIRNGYGYDFMQLIPSSVLVESIE